MKEYMLENSKKMKLAVDFSMNQIPKLSIAIPVYKRHLAVKDLMNSLCRQGNIPKEDWEIVIADDSAEQTCLQNVCHEMQKHKNLPIRYYQNEENIGAASNWNRCMELARAEWVFMIHADDVELNLRAMQNGFRIAGTDSVFIVKREGENDTATSSMEYRISWINSIAEMFLASRMIPRGGIYDLLWKLRFRDIAAWGGGGTLCAGG